MIFTDENSNDEILERMAEDYCYIRKMVSIIDFAFCCYFGINIELRVYYISSQFIDSRKNILLLIYFAR